MALVTPTSGMVFQSLEERRTPPPPPGQNGMALIQLPYFSFSPSHLQYVDNGTNLFYRASGFRIAYSFYFYPALYPHQYLNNR